MNSTQLHQLPLAPWEFLAFENTYTDHHLSFACMNLLLKTKTLTKRYKDNHVLNLQLTHLCKKVTFQALNRENAYSLLYSLKHYPMQAEFVSLL